MAAVRWVEARSGLTSADCVGQSPLLKLSAERAIVVLGTNGETVRKAPRVPLVVIAALENKVVSGDLSIGRHSHLGVDPVDQGLWAAPV